MTPETPAYGPTPSTAADCAPVPAAAWVYLLRCPDGSLYGGWTNDLARRLKAHQSGKGGAKYTKSHGRAAVRLAYAEKCADKSAALKREAAIKKLPKAEKEALAAKRALSRKGVPTEGRFMIVSPEYLEVLMQDPKYIKQGDLSQQLVQQGVIGRIAGFNVLESNNMDYESTTRVSGKKTTTEFICGHPNWCHRVMEWQVAVHLQDLSGSGKYIGASAVQGRKVYGLMVSKPQTLYIKRVETTA